jgi:hypothetical protein
MPRSRDALVLVCQHRQLEGTLDALQLRTVEITLAGGANFGWALPGGGVCLAPMMGTLGIRLRTHLVG